MVKSVSDSDKRRLAVTRTADQTASYVERPADL